MLNNERKAVFALIFVIEGKNTKTLKQIRLVKTKLYILALGEILLAFEAGFKSCAFSHRLPGGGASIVRRSEVGEWLEKQKAIILQI